MRPKSVPLSIVTTGLSVCLVMLLTTVLLKAGKIDRPALEAVLLAASVAAVGGTAVLSAILSRGRINGQDDPASRSRSFAESGPDIAQRFLKQQDIVFKTLFDPLSFGMCLLSPKNYILKANVKFGRILGYSAEELQDVSLIDLALPGEEQELEAFCLNPPGEQDHSARTERRLARKDGKYMWVELSVLPMPVREKDSRHLLMVLQDINERKLAEKALEASETGLKKAQAIAHMGSWEADILYRQVNASEEACRIYGLGTNREPIPWETIRNAVIPKDRPEFDRALKRLLDTDEKFDMEFRIQSAENGREKTIHALAVSERDEDGTPVKIIGVVLDITDLRRIESELKIAQMKYTSAFQQAPIGIGVSDSTTGRIYCTNQKFRDIVGRSVTGLQELYAEQSIFSPGDPQNENGTGRTEGAGSAGYRRERLLRPDGSAVWIKRTMARINTGREEDGIILWMLEDISDQVSAEEALAASEHKHKTMVSNISDVILIVGRDFRATYCSPNVGKKSGWSSKDLLGRDVRTILHPDEAEKLQKFFLRLLESDTGNGQALELRYLCKDGTYRLMEAAATNLLRDESIQGILFNVQDITERKKREEEIYYLYYHDVLTGLYNRAFFDEEQKRLDTPRQLPLSVIIGDINGLKLINDAFGHAEGDKMLKEIARILRLCTRKEDIVARTGGDEFSILLPQTSGEEARDIVERIEAMCRETAANPGIGVFFTSISLGHASKVSEEESFQAVLRAAEEIMYKRKLLEHKSLHGSIIASIRMTMHEKSHETEEQTGRVATLSKTLGKAIGLSEKQLNELELLSTIHDIGKISIDEDVLCKPGKLTEEEWYQLKKHPEVGYRIAQASPELKHIADLILCHHERWDGSGYPQGLAGTDIPLLSRAMAVVDSFQAMTHDKPYRKAMTREAALEELERNAGTQFDPDIVEAFVRHIRDMEAG